MSSSTYLKERLRTTASEIKIKKLLCYYVAALILNKIQKKKIKRLKKFPCLKCVYFTECASLFLVSNPVIRIIHKWHRCKENNTRSQKLCENQNVEINSEAQRVHWTDTSQCSYCKCFLVRCCFSRQNKKCHETKAKGSQQADPSSSNAVRPSSHYYSSSYRVSSENVTKLFKFFLLRPINFLKTNNVNINVSKSYSQLASYMQL